MKTATDFYELVCNRDLIFTGDINKKCNGTGYYPLEYAIEKRNSLIYMALYHGADIKDLPMKVVEKLFKNHLDVINHFGLRIPVKVFNMSDDQKIIDYGISQGLVVEDFYKRYKAKDYSNVNITNSDNQTLLAYAIERDDKDVITALMKIRAPLYASETLKVSEIKQFLGGETISARETLKVSDVKQFLGGETISARSLGTNNVPVESASASSSSFNTDGAKMAIYYDPNETYSDDDESFSHPYVGKHRSEPVAKESDNKHSPEPVAKESDDKHRSEPATPVVRESILDQIEDAVLGDGFKEVTELVDSDDDFEFVIADKILAVIKENDIVEILRVLYAANDSERVHIINHITDEKTKGLVKKIF